MWSTSIRRQEERLESQDSSLEVLNGAEMVLNWQFCIILHYFAHGWRMVRENCSCFGAEFCNMVQNAAMISSSIAWGGRHSNNPGVVWWSETLGLISTGCRMLHVVHKHEETGKA